MIARRLHSVLLAAGVPIIGVDIGTSTDSTTWRVRPPSLQAAAQPTIDAFDPNDPAYLTAERDAEIDSLLAMRALAEATYELKTTSWTKAQFIARIKAIYRTL